ncbi:hypothetical protein CEXT_475001 [Caerostris extrusa]|uniref:Uncharacterized protein n=1 Tax=Caerostris extrusa TaxID=172846 RepID=A0AAV4N2A2_CAEEX|nr:hypothetical protein CEXT_475001 [Caerostris extrusa]
MIEISSCIYSSNSNLLNQSSVPPSVEGIDVSKNWFLKVFFLKVVLSSGGPECPSEITTTQASEIDAISKTLVLP